MNRGSFQTNKRWGFILCGFLLILFSDPDAVYADIHRYEITATYDEAKHRIEGMEKVTLTNTGDTPLSEVYLFLYPNLFLNKDPKRNEDFYLRAYPTQFNSGSMEIRAIHDREGNPIPVSDFFGIKILEEVRLNTPIPPGASFEFSVQFVTQIPERFGVFGQFRKQVTLEGGWHPYLPPLINGKWDLHSPPPVSAFDVTLTLPASVEPMASTGLEMIHQEETTKTVSGSAVLPFFSLSLGHKSVRMEEKMERRIVSYSGPEDNQAYGAQVLESAVRAVSFFQSAWGSLPERDIPMVHAYLHQDLVMVGARLLYVDSKLFKVLPVLKRFHDLRVARGVFILLLQEILFWEEPWVIETMASLLADRYARHYDPDTPDLKSWLKPVAFFPFVDQIFYSKKVPLRQVYFKEIPGDTETLLSFHRPHPGGILGSTRLTKQMGSEKLSRVLDDYSAHLPSQKHPKFIESLVRLYPEMERGVAMRNQVFSPVDIGIEKIETQKINEEYHTTIHLKKDTQDVEPVEMVVQEKNGQTIPLLWNGEGGRHKMAVVTLSPIVALTLDPQDKVYDIKPGNNRYPRLWKVLLNRYTLGYDLTTDFLRYGAGLVFQPVYDATDQIGVNFLHVDQMDWGGLHYSRTFHNRHLLTTGISYRTLRSMKSIQLEDIGVVSLAYTFRFADMPFLADALEWLTGQSPRLTVTLGYDQRFTGDRDETLKSVRMDLRRSFHFAHYHEMSARFFMGFSEGTLFKENRFFLGGEGGLRGYTPLRFEGDDMSFLSLEYRFPLLYETGMNLAGLAMTHTLQGAIFVDAGSIADHKEAFHLSEIRSDIGAGLRWFVDSFGIMPVILRADVAWPIDSPVEAEQTPHYYISAGQPF